MQERIIKKIIFFFALLIRHFSITMRINIYAFNKTAEAAATAVEAEATEEEKKIKFENSL